MGKLIYVNSKGKAEELTKIDTSHLYNAHRKAIREGDPVFHALEAEITRRKKEETVHVRTDRDSAS